MSGKNIELKSDSTAGSRKTGPSLIIINNNENL